MQSSDQIARAWTADRPYLIDLAFRILGDIGAAEDIVQEAFFRLVQTPLGGVDDARGWLIVVTSRLCLDHIKSAPWRRERPADMAARSYRDIGSAAVDPADRVTLDDEVRLALLVMLEHLTPAERVAFVLHDVFALPFQLVAETVGRPSAACRQLASRARRKVRESRDAGRVPVEPAGHRLITRRFIMACANGDLDELLAVLDPDASGELDVRSDFVVVGATRGPQHASLLESAGFGACLPTHQRPSGSAGVRRATARRVHRSVGFGQRSDHSRPRPCRRSLTKSCTRPALWCHFALMSQSRPLPRPCQHVLTRQAAPEAHHDRIPSRAVPDG